MALSKASFPSDRTRFVRLALVIVEELTPVLRDVIESEISSNDIFNLVRSNSTLSKKLRNDQLFIIQKASIDGYRDFDITLLYTLIRNLCKNISPPTQGWGISKLPTQGETSDGDDIERIRLIKNNLYSHVPSTCISETQFTAYWTVINDVCQRMGNRLHKNYVQSLQKSQHRPLDEELEKWWIEKIKESCEREKDMVEKFAKLEASVERLAKEWRSATATVDATLTGPEKNEVAVLFLNTASDLLNHIVDCIDEHIKEDELREIYDRIAEFLKDESKEISRSLLEPFLDKLSSKIKAYANTQPRKINILFKFTKFILDLKRNYGAEIRSRIGSLLLMLTFRSEKGLEIYNKDLDGGEIGKMILDLLLYPPYLACFDLQTENLIILLNNQKIYHNTDKEQFGGRLTNKAYGVYPSKMKENLSQSQMEMDEESCDKFLDKDTCDGSDLRKDKVQFRMNSDAYEVMKGKPWKAINFDWDFSVDDNGLRRGTAVIHERQSFITMLEKLEFQIYPFDQKNVKLTRNLSKSGFLKELNEFKRLCCEEPCGCLLVTVSSHGVILPQNEQRDGQTDNVETYEDYVLTHPEPDKKKFSPKFKDECVSVREIVKIFRDQSLKGIPKIFFIQACRDDSKQISGDPGVDVGVQLFVGEEDSVSDISVEIPRTPSENQIVYSLPCIDDSVIVFSTPFGYAAGFNSVRGSHVWSDLSKTFNEFKKKQRPVNLLDLLRETNWQLSQSKNTVGIKEDIVEYKPLLSICHKLTRHIVFDRKADEKKAMQQD